jgi:hypothetical protein
VYPHDRKEKDLVLFHNRGVLHTVVGAFKPDQVHAFYQCDVAASDEPVTGGTHTGGCDAVCVNLSLAYMRHLYPRDLL